MRIILIVGVSMLFTTNTLAQEEILGDKLNTADFINDINQELNDHKPHGEYRSYVISGVFKELSNARAFMKTYRKEATNEVFIFKEPNDKYYVAVKGPITLEEAKALTTKLNQQASTQNLSNGHVWILTK